MKDAAKAAVLAAFPSAREEPRGLGYVAIMARSRDDGILRDKWLGSGKTSDAAWKDALERMSDA